MIVPVLHGSLCKEGIKTKVVAEGKAVVIPTSWKVM
jgi:hypothetical protein